MNHYFDVNIAKTYSVQQAIVLNNFAIRHKFLEKNNYFVEKGLTFFEVIRVKLCKQIEYFSDKTIARILNKCVEDGLLEKKVDDENRFKVRTWYALTDMSMSLLNIHRPDGTTEVLHTIAVDTLSDVQSPALPKMDSFCSIFCTLKGLNCADQRVLYIINYILLILYILLLLNIKNKNKISIQGITSLILYGDIDDQSIRKFKKKGFFCDSDFLFIFLLQKFFKFGLDGKYKSRYSTLLSQCEYYIADGVRRGFSIKQSKKGLLKLLVTGKFSEPRGWKTEKDASAQIKYTIKDGVKVEATDENLYREYVGRVKTDIMLKLVRPSKMKNYAKWIKAGKPNQEPLQY